MKQHYLRLFAYDYWANGLVLSELQDMETPDERSLSLITHILAAQSIWLERITKTKRHQTIWETQPLEICKANYEANYRDWLVFLNDLSDGHLYDILTHVVNHGSYHRGQIAASLKGKIEQVQATDFIVYAGLDM
jgi:uncharacterized damage-inducible protein DinB